MGSVQAGMTCFIFAAIQQLTQRPGLYHEEKDTIQDRGKLCVIFILILDDLLTCFVVSEGQTSWRGALYTNLRVSDRSLIRL